MAQLALIIGNGFDLDLGLPSKYSDFMDSPEWRNILSGVRSSYHGEELNHSPSRAARLSCVPAVASTTLSGCRAAASRVEELFVAQGLIKMVKLKYCGIKDFHEK